MNAWASDASSFELITLNETNQGNTESEKPALPKSFSLGMSYPEINTPSTQNNTPPPDNHYDDESESESEHQNTHQPPHLLVSGQSDALSSLSVSSLSSVHVSPEQTDEATQTDSSPQTTEPQQTAEHDTQTDSSSPQSVATQTTEPQQTAEHDTQTHTVLTKSKDAQTDTPPSSASQKPDIHNLKKNAFPSQAESVEKKQVQKTSWQQLADYGYKVWSTTKQKIETMIKEFGDRKKTANHGMAPSNQTFYSRMCLMWNDTLIFVKRTISNALHNIAHIWKGTKTKVKDIEQCLNDFVKRTTHTIHDPDQLLTPPLLPQSRMVASKKTFEHDTKTYTLSTKSKDAQTYTPPSSASQKPDIHNLKKNAFPSQPESVEKQQVQKTSWHQLADYGYKVWSTTKQKIETMIKEFGDRKKTANHGMAPSNQTFYRRMCLMWNDTLIFVKRTISNALHNIAHIWKGTKTKVKDIEQCLNDFLHRTAQTIHDPDQLLTPPLLPQSRMVAYNDDRFWSVRKKTADHTIQDPESGQSIYA